MTAALNFGLDEPAGEDIIHHISNKFVHNTEYCCTALNIWWIDITAQPQWNLCQLCELSLPQVLKHAAKKRFTEVGIFLIYRDGQPPLANDLYY